jgi:hypothetical protein
MLLLLLGGCRYYDISSEEPMIFTHTVKPGYNYISLCDTSTTASDILWYQLIPLGYNNTRL